MPDILCFGDSNTHGTMALPDFLTFGRHALERRWPEVMDVALGADWTEIAEGNPGRMVRWAAQLQQKSNTME